MTILRWAKRRRLALMVLLFALAELGWAVKRVEKGCDSPEFSG